jgi:hypothetical protein
MTRSPKLMLAAAALAITGTVGIAGTAAQAATQCPAGLGKTELDGTSSSVYTGLPEGTMVCIKAGTQTAIVYVDEFGYITNDAIFNQSGNARGISNYVWYTYTPPPS